MQGYSLGPADYPVLQHHVFLTCSTCEPLNLISLQNQLLPGKLLPILYLCSILFPLTVQKLELHSSPVQMSFTVFYILPSISVFPTLILNFVFLPEIILCAAWIWFSFLRDCLLIQYFLKNGQNRNWLAAEGLDRLVVS